MPIYEYQCEKCREIFEILELSEDDKPEKCEKCGGALRKLISEGSFVLKGTGWYKTDYQNKPKKKTPS